MFDARVRPRLLAASARLTVVASVLVALVPAVARPAHAATVLRVPESYATIAAAIIAAAPGDTIDVAPGTYSGAVTLNKSVTLRGRFGDSNDPRNNTTILQAAPSIDVITVPSGISPAPTITGLVLRNGLSGISMKSPTSVSANYFIANNDQLDYKIGGGGLALGNVFAEAMDDGIDINHPVADLLIDGNRMIDSGGDGVEMRLNDDTIATTAHITFRNNEISGSRSDGIQIIDYFTDTNRVIAIERNSIHNNGRAGVGLLDGGTTIEDYRAASIRERITVIHNTFVGNNHGISGGDNLFALNNVLVGHFLGMKNVDGASIASHNIFWQNTTNTSGSNVEASIVADPKLDSAYRLQTGSPAIDAGVAHFERNGEVILDETFNGAAPDLGWKETTATPGGGSPPVMSSVTISPSSPGTAATVTANATATDPDGDAITFAYQWAKNGTNLPGGQAKTLDLSVAGNGNKGDQLTVTVTASDGVGSSSPLTSSAVTVANTDPTFNQNLGNRSNGEGDVVAISAAAADPDADPLTYAASGLPGGLSISAVTGSISGTIAPGAAGSSPYTVTVTVRDGATVDATDTFTWTITTTSTGSITLHGASGVAYAQRAAVPLPRPAGVVAGDVEVAAIVIVGSATVTPPPGWSPVRTDTNGSMRQIVYVHVAGASEPSTHRWVLSSTSRVAGTLSAYAGVDPAAPIVGAGQANASSTSIVAPGVSAASAGEMLVGFFGIVADTSNAIAPPSGMTERVEVTPATGKPRPALELCDVVLAAAGSSGTRTATATVPGVNVGQVVVLRAG